VLANVRHAEGSPLLDKVTAAEQGPDIVSPPADRGDERLSVSAGVIS
jgi:hypothetical protein